MRVEDLLQIAVVDEDDAVTFQNEFNKKNIIGTLKVIGATIAFILFMGVEWF